MTVHHNRRNVGIFAHVDAGKTTTTEQLLYLSGKIRAPGSVDDGTAQTDWLDVERARGISVRAASTTFQWRGVTVNLVDTPGHVDFLAEVERSMRVLDGAVLIVSAAEGVQAQTEVLWHALRQLGIPTILYMNKMDRIGADASRVLADIVRQLSPRVVPIQSPIGVESDYKGNVNLLDTASTSIVSGEMNLEHNLATIIEQLAEMDEEMLVRYLEGETIPLATLNDAIVRYTHSGDIFPVLFGASGKGGLGVSALLDAIIDYLPAPAGDLDVPPAGVVFRVERDRTMGRMAFVRLYRGQLRNRDAVQLHGNEEKITQIRKISGQKAEDTGVLEAGDIAAVFGLSSACIGDIIGDEAFVPSSPRLAIPLLTLQVEPTEPQHYTALVAALQELADEDPLLDLEWLQEDRELHIKVMGPIQLEVLNSVLQSRYGLNAKFGEPAVIYKETPSQAGEGFIAYTMPKPCWAILRFAIEPLPRGSGLHYEARVRAENLLPSYQNEVARRVPEALKQGLFGWEVTDLKVTLIEGEHHVWHTHPLDFVVATPMGIMNGLVRIGTRLLEPMLRFRIAAPEENGGRIMSDLAAMRGEFDPPNVQGGRIVIEGTLPVATSLDYAVRLSAYTGGRGSLTTWFSGYSECPSDVRAERKRLGVNPLDQARYILAARKALG